MEQLPPQMLPTVPHVAFGIFNLAIPNIIVWSTLIIVLFVAVWARLPDFIKPRS